MWNWETVLFTINSINSVVESPINEENYKAKENSHVAEHKVGCACLRNCNCGTKMLIKNYASTQIIIKNKSLDVCVKNWKIKALYNALLDNLGQQHVLMCFAFKYF